MSDPLRIGFVGAGSIVRERHVPGLRALEGIEFRAVCNSTPESSRRAAEEFGIAETCSCWEELVVRPDLDVVWIGTTPHLHEAVTLAALEAGKHVFCQARMAMDASSARRMLAASEARPDQVTMLCPPPMGMASGATFKRLLDSGVIGAPGHLTFRALQWMWTDPQAPLHWRQDIEKSGLNTLTVGIFAEVLGNWLGYPESLIAQVQTVRDLQGNQKVQIPDVVQMVAEWENGWKGSLEWSGVARSAPGPRLECYGTEGTLVYDFSDESVWLAEGAGPLEVVDIPAHEKGEWDVEERFVRAVRENGNPEPSFRTGVRYMQFVEAVHRSAEIGRRVRLEKVETLDTSLISPKND
jgi:predicted dehydrogenase